MKGRDYKGILETLLTLDSISVLGGWESDSPHTKGGR